MAFNSGKMPLMSATELLPALESFTLDANARLALAQVPADIVHKLEPGGTVPDDLLLPGGDCAASQLYLQIRGIQPKMSSNGCAVIYLEYQLVLGIVRCVAVIDDRGQPPSMLQNARDGVKAFDDMRTLYATLECSPYKITQLYWTPRGNSGGVGGGEWAFTLHVKHCTNC